MKRLEQVIRTYFCRELFTEGSFIWAYQTLPFMMLVMGAVMYSHSESLADRVHLIYAISFFTLGIILTLLNYVGAKTFPKSGNLKWLWLPYVTALYSLIWAWIGGILYLHKDFDVSPASQQFLIYYPIIYPLVIFTMYYTLFNVSKDKDPKKDILRRIMAYTVLLPFIIFSALTLTTALFRIDGYGFAGYTFGSFMALMTLSMPFSFTGSSMYWHPEETKPRYGNALKALNSTKKTKVQKQKLKLK